MDRFIKSTETVQVGDAEAPVFMLKKEYEKEILDLIFTDELKSALEKLTLEEQVEKCAIASEDYTKGNAQIPIADIMTVKTNWKWGVKLDVYGIDGVLCTEDKLLLGVYIYEKMLFLGSKIDFIGEYWYEGDNNGAGYKEGGYIKTTKHITLFYDPRLVVHDTFYSSDADPEAEEITVPEGITTIDMSAFKKCQKLKKVNLPSTIVKISSYAFEKCKSLEEINMPKGLSFIGSYAFNGCESLKSIEIPENVEVIPSGAFSDCKSLKSLSLPKGDIKIESWAFYKCCNLEKIENSQSIIAIGEYSFCDCYSLKEITLSKDFTGSIFKSAFSSCKSLKSFVVPPKASIISAYAFSFCDNLEIVKIPPNVFMIGSEAFFECPKLRYAIIPRDLEEEFKKATDEDADIEIEWI